jgi:polyphosphate kinase 2 (PPK2 family)
MKAYEDALAETSTDEAPWIIVPANQKWFRNYVVARVVVDALEKLKMSYPKPDLSKVNLVEQ